MSASKNFIKGSEIVKNFAFVLVLSFACFAGGAIFQKNRTSQLPVAVHKVDGVVGCCTNKCPCDDCSCEACDCASKEISFAEIRKQLSDLDRNCCERKAPVLVHRPWLDWVVNYKD